LVRTFEKESVLLNLDSESYHGLDDVRRRRWQALTSSANIQVAGEKLRADYMREDVDDFVPKMVQRGLLAIQEIK
jgi:hypothetical protein